MQCCGLASRCVLDRAEEDRRGDRVAMNTFRFAAALLAGGVLTACSQTAVDGERAITRIDEALSASMAEATAPVAVSGGLTAALKGAVEANPAYRAAEARAREATARLAAARSAQRPQIEGSGNLGVVREGNPVDDTTFGLDAQLSVTQLVYDGGQTSARIDGALARALAAEAGVAETGGEVALRAGQAWIDLWQFGARRAALEERVGLMRAALGQMERLIAGGMIDKAALASAERLILGIEIEQEQYDARIRDARARYERYFGTAPKSVSRPAAALDAAGVARAGKLWGEAPALRRLAAEKIAAEDDLRVAEGRTSPTVQLRSGLTSPVGEGESTDIAAGLVVSYTFGDGGRRAAEIKAAGEAVSASAGALSEARAEAQSALATAQASYRSLGVALGLLDRQLEKLEDEKATTRSQLALGQSSIRDLVDAEIESYRANDRRISTEAEQMSIALQIAARTGQLAERLGLVSTPGSMLAAAAAEPAPTPGE